MTSGAGGPRSIRRHGALAHQCTAERSVMRVRPLIEPHRPTARRARIRRARSIARPRDDPTVVLGHDRRKAIPCRAVVADLTAEEAADLGPLLKQASGCTQELSNTDQVYVCLWSHSGWVPGHIHFVVQPAWNDVRDRYSGPSPVPLRSEEHTSELQSRFDLVCRLLLEKKKKTISKNLTL